MIFTYQSSKIDQNEFLIILQTGPAADFHDLEKYIGIAFEELLPENANASMSKIWADAINNPISASK